jgi:hypothetical protein
MDSSRTHVYASSEFVFIKIKKLIRKMAGSEFPAEISRKTSSNLEKNATPTKNSITRL